MKNGAKRPPTLKKMGGFVITYNPVNLYYTTDVYSVWMWVLHVMLAILRQLQNQESRAAYEVNDTY